MAQTQNAPLVTPALEILPLAQIKKLKAITLERKVLPTTIVVWIGQMHIPNVRKLVLVGQMQNALRIINALVTSIASFFDWILFGSVIIA